MDCGGVLVKYILFVANIIFVICGILLIVFGSLILSDMGGFSNLEQAWEINSGPIVLIILGSIIFLIAFMGCYGAIRESGCFVFMYSIVMLALAIFQLTLIIYVWVNRNDITTTIEKFVQGVWDERNTSTAPMDSLQISFKCCGRQGPFDYLGSIPNSCCGADATSCTHLDVVRTPGCIDAMTDYWDKNMDIIVYAGLGIAAVEICAFIFSYCLYNGIRNNDRRGHY